MLPWDGFVDPDAFYHAKTSALVWSGGPLQAFPWLDLTLVGQHYADLHFLFHAAAAPFTAAFGMFQGVRILAVILAAACLTTVYAVLRGLRLWRPEFWVMLLAATQPFVTRILYGKASPLAILFFLFGLWAVWRRRPWLAASAGALYALAHGGWLYLAGSAVILWFGRLIVDRDLSGSPLRTAVFAGPWKEVAAVFAGGVLGMLVHPNFPENLIFSWTQVFVIGLRTPFDHVVLGNEWRPAELASVATAYAPWLIALVLGLSGLALAPRKQFDKDKAGLCLGFGILTAVLLALTLKSRRNTEFLAPVVAVWCASIWSMVDARTLAGSFMKSLAWYGSVGRKAILGSLAVLALALVGREIHGIRESLHPVGYPDTIHAEAMRPVSAAAKPGDRVFHSSWDEFPVLFALDDRLRYVSGMDPTFLYVASSTLSDEVRELTWGQTTSSKELAWSLIHDKLDSKFVFVSKREIHTRFLALIESDPRYVKLAETEDGVSFGVRP